MSNDTDNKNNSDNTKVEFSYFKPIRSLILIFLAGIAVYFFISTITLIALVKPPREVKVPNITGKKFIEVSSALSRENLRTELKFIDVYDIEDGIILYQHPDSGQIVKENDKLTLTLSRNKFFIDMPELTGSELPIAINKLRNMHYQDKKIAIAAGVISYIPSEKTASNIVIDQSPKAGSKISPDVKVNLLVSTGDSGIDKKMPDVTDQSIDLCYDLLLAKGLIIKEEIVKTGDIDKSGLVIRQSIPPNRIIKDGESVTVAVNFYKLKEHPYSSYEFVEYVIPADQPSGLYEAYIEDDLSKRIRFSAQMNPGQKIQFVFHRHGNAKIYINCDKKNIRITPINANF
ncbi:MAG: PASTA domain-containing protein [Leptospirales bacterium]|nr:PASTA domain-containing protein [Leptospirales bacterium]